MTTATAPAAEKAASKELALRDEPQLTPFEVIERVITNGDLARMAPAERVAFYWRTCESLGLNPLTRPFEFISLNGKLTMYARKDATDQLRKINGVTVTAVTREKDEDLGLITVFARGRDKTGREDEATGVVAIKGLSGEALANALMKAETKAKRRLTLSLVGLGFLDESELEGATIDVDPATGEILERAKPKSLLESVREQQEALANQAADPDQPAEPAADETEGQATWLAEGGSSEPNLADRIRISAGDSDLEGDPTDDQREALGQLFQGMSAPTTLAGIGALFEGAIVDGRAHLTAAQAAGILLVAGSLDREALHAAWAQLGTPA